MGIYVHFHPKSSVFWVIVVIINGRKIGINGKNIMTSGKNNLMNGIYLLLFNQAKRFSKNNKNFHYFPGEN